MYSFDFNMTRKFIQITILLIFIVTTIQSQQVKWYKTFGYNDTINDFRLFNRHNMPILFSSSKQIGFNHTDSWYVYLFAIQQNGNALWKKYVDANHPYYFLPGISDIHYKEFESKMQFTSSYLIRDTLTIKEERGIVLFQTDTTFTTVDYCYYINLGDTTLYTYKTIKTSDNGYVVLGAYAYYPAPPNWVDPFYILKTDSVFNPQWMKSYKNLDGSLVSTIITTLDGGFVVGGTTKQNNFPGSPANAPFYMKTDSTGNILWLKKVYLPVAYPGYDITCVKETPNGDLLIGGYIKDTTTVVTLPMLLIKADASGNIIWDKRYTPFRGGVIRDFIIEDDGSITTSGEVSLPSGNYSCLMHLDSMGNYVWGWYSYNNLSYPQVIKADDGGYMLTTLLYPDLAKTDSLGNIGCWDYVMPAPVVSTGLLMATDTLTVEPLFPTRHSINLYIHNAPPFQDTTYCYGYTGVMEVENNKQTKTKVYPNPVGDKATIACPDGMATVNVYDVSGKKVLQEQNVASNNAIQINTSTLVNGFYTYKIQGEDIFRTGSFIK